MQIITKVLVLIFLNLKVALCFELDCRFVDYPDGYNCVMMTNLVKNDNVTSVAGDHKEYKNNLSVASLYILYSSRTRFVPFGVCTQFENLKQFDINGQRVTEITSDILEGCSGITTFIVRNSRIKSLDENLLKNVKLLEHFTLDSTLVEYLPESFFKYNKNLKQILLNANKLKVINVIFPTTLTMLRLFSNMCINNGYLSSDSRSTPLIMLIEEVKNNCNNLTNQLSTTQKIDTANEQIIQLLEEKIHLFKDNLATIRMSSITSITMELKRALIAQMQFELIFKNSRNISEINGQLETLEINHGAIERGLNDAILLCRQLEVELDDFESLSEKYDAFREENNTLENHMIIIFCVQVVTIAFVIYKSYLLVNRLKK